MPLILKDVRLADSVGSAADYIRSVPGYIADSSDHIDGSAQRFAECVARARFHPAQIGLQFRPARLDRRPVGGIRRQVQQDGPARLDRAPDVVHLARPDCPSRRCRRAATSAPASAPTSRATMQVALTVLFLPARSSTRRAHNCWRTGCGAARAPTSTHRGRRAVRVPSSPHRSGARTCLAAPRS